MSGDISFSKGSRSDEQAGSWLEKRDQHLRESDDDGEGEWAAADEVCTKDISAHTETELKSYHQESSVDWDTESGAMSLSTSKDQALCNLDDEEKQQPGLLDRINLWLWSGFGEGCDEYQHEAVRKWRHTNGFGILEAVPNAFCEYPRISRRFPQAPPAMMPPTLCRAVTCCCSPADAVRFAVCVQLPGCAVSA